MKPLFTYLLVLCFALFSTQRSMGQNNDIIPPIPLSPEAALLHQFVDVPVGYFTGTASISVPIYSIELSTLSIPVSVDYHSSGHKVDQMATSVGWGWSLNAGGMISFNQIGLNDFEAGGYVNGVFDLSNLSYTDKVMMTGTGWNQPIPFLDTQPDIFYFSFPGKNGKFLYDTEGIPFTIPFIPIKIIRDPLNGHFQIKDEIGNLFTFNLMETSAWSNNQNPDEVYNSSADYYLTQISTPNGEIVNFEYRHETQQTFYNIQTENRTLDSNPCETPTYAYSESNYILNNIGTYQLDRIISNYGHVIDFVYSPSIREDCNSASCAALNGIKIYYQTNPVPIKEFIVTTSYFTAANPGLYGYKNKRLKLDSITELGKGCYAFDYYDKNSTAALHSYSQDLYGYNNGVFNNWTLVPSYPGVFQGADRNPNLQALLAGTLKSLRYPTGGESIFTYELNQNDNQEYIGGVRIKSICELLDSDTLKFRQFSYSNPITAPTPVFAQNRTSYTLETTPVCYLNGIYYEDCHQCSFCPINYLEITSHSRTGLNGIVGGSVGYLAVEETFGIAGHGGKKQYFFGGTNIGGNSGYWPYRPESDRNGINGYLIKEINFSYENGQFYLVSSLINSYDLKVRSDYINGVTIPVMYSECAGCIPYWCQTHNAVFGPISYNTYLSLNMDLIATEERHYEYLTLPSDFNTTSKYISQLIEYEYTSPNHPFITEEKTTNSDGAESQSEYKYPSDYQVSSYPLNQMSSALLFMQNNHMIKFPIEEITSCKDSITMASLQLFKLNEYNRLVPEKKLITELATPLQRGYFTESYINGSNVFAYDSSKYRTEIYYDKLSELGKLQQYHFSNNQYRSFIWNYNDHYILARAENSSYSDIAYTGFEDISYGGWTYQSGNRSTSYARTGRYSCVNAIMQKTVSVNSIVSLWVKSGGGTPSISGFTPKVFGTTDGWIYYEWNVSPGSITVYGSNCYVDDLRLYPVGAMMTTYTYDPLVGMTSSTDPNGIITTYEYDSFGRLKNVRDNDGKIIARNYYHYYNDTSSDTPYLNTSPTSMSFGSGASSSSLSISSNTSWSITDNASWLSVNTTSGTGNATITVSATANTSAARNATITITYAGGLTKTVSVSQAAGSTSTLLVSPMTISFGYLASPVMVTISSNTSWTVTKSASWITISATSGTGNGTITVRGSKLLTGTRSGTVTIKTTNNAVTRIINVYQDSELIEL